tara:strand:- start:1853 stop:2023 length:171 start_codon:yes stop_codon:yes gene_type:complete
VFIGVAVYTVSDYLVKKWCSHNGSGFLIAITLEDIPDKLALAIALIATPPHYYIPF